MEAQADLTSTVIEPSTLPGEGSPASLGVDPRDSDKPKFEYPDGSGKFYEIQSDAKGEYIVDGEGKRHDFVYQAVQEMSF